ncbi:hypothetical protein EVAR_67561_1 [Eumeta japonica]|uniref:Uncharacterized protein n=1 Tax=Eumeta variegata TaxID=151549 RepID=A0A4C1ZHV1_EUMVA|nr:hypothetical protein EVAR_67561_1 [Eumeta japonica]
MLCTGTQFGTFSVQFPWPRYPSPEGASDRCGPMRRAQIRPATHLHAAGRPYRHSRPRRHRVTARPDNRTNRALTRMSFSVSFPRRPAPAQDARARRSLQFLRHLKPSRSTQHYKYLIRDLYDTPDQIKLTLLFTGEEYPFAVQAYKNSSKMSYRIAQGDGVDNGYVSDKKVGNVAEGQREFSIITADLPPKTAGVRVKREAARARDRNLVTRPNLSPTNRMQFCHGFSSHLLVFVVS